MDLEQREDQPVVMEDMTLVVQAGMAKIIIPLAAEAAVPAVAVDILHRLSEAVELPAEAAEAAEVVV